MARVSRSAYGVAHASQWCAYISGAQWGLICMRDSRAVNPCHRFRDLRTGERMFPNCAHVSGAQLGLDLHESCDSFRGDPFRTICTLAKYLADGLHLSMTA